MNNSAQAKNYAVAFFQLAPSKEFLKKNVRDMEALLMLVQKDSLFWKFLLMPGTRKQEKKRLIQTIFGNRADAALINFLCYLLDRRKIALIPAIIPKYRELALDALGILEIVATTASPMSRQEKAALEAKALKVFHKNAVFKEIINPEVIGGMRLSFQNKWFDFTVKRRIGQLKTQMLKTVSP